MREARLLHDIRAALNLDGRCRVVRNSCGFDLERKVRYGLGNGSPDLIGVLRDGRVFAIEVKAPGGRVSPDQASWWRAARAWNVSGGVVHSVAEAMALLEMALRVSA